jgi:ADP-ribosylglycohydrolase
MDSEQNWISQFKTKEDPYCQILMAYAAGDAFGAFYEFNESISEIDAELKAKPDWLLGSVSDDTLLTLITIFSIQSDHPGSKYLELLRTNIPNLRGLGPTTRTALGLPVKQNERGEIGNTNGGMMRSALLGLAQPSDQVLIDLVSVTHKHPDAIDFALAMAKLFGGSKVPEFSRPETPIGLHPREAFTATCYVVNQANSTLDAYMRACQLGGDTDTVAALSGALYLLNNPDDDFYGIKWLPLVNWSEIASDIDKAVLILRAQA